eukprot:9491731-Pyramimonas_sp.AAC.1
MRGLRYLWRQHRRQRLGIREPSALWRHLAAGRLGPRRCAAWQRERPCPLGSPPLLLFLSSSSSSSSSLPPPPP